MSGLDAAVAIILGIAVILAFFFLGLQLLRTRRGGAVGGEIGVGSIFTAKFHVEVPQREQATTAIARAAEQRGEADQPQEALRRVHRVDEVRSGRILWVDDHPEQNVNESIALLSLGGSIVTAVDTSGARSFLEAGLHFDVVVTDIGRPGNPRAGVELIDEMRGNGLKLPIFVYTSSNHPLAGEAVVAGATLVTASPAELVSAYLNVVSET